MFIFIIFLISLMLITVAVWMFKITTVREQPNIELIDTQISVFSIIAFILVIIASYRSFIYAIAFLAWTLFIIYVNFTLDK